MSVCLTLAQADLIASIPWDRTNASVNSHCNHYLLNRNQHTLRILFFSMKKFNSIDRNEITNASKNLVVKIYN